MTDGDDPDGEDDGGHHCERRPPRRGQTSLSERHRQPRREWAQRPKRAVDANLSLLQKRSPPSQGATLHRPQKVRGHGTPGRGVSASPRSCQSLEETLTVILLGISPSLLRIFKSTNPIESMICSKNRDRQRQALAQRRDHPALDRGGSGGGREAVPPPQRLPRPPAVARRAGEDAANRRCPDRHRGQTRPGPQETRPAAIGSASIVVRDDLCASLRPRAASPGHQQSAASPLLPSLPLAGYRRRQQDLPEDFPR